MKATILRQAASNIMKLALPIHERAYPGDTRLRETCNMTNQWCKGKVTDAQLATAREEANKVYELAVTQYENFITYEGAYSESPTIDETCYNIAFTVAGAIADPTYSDWGCLKTTVVSVWRALRKQA